MAEEKPPRERWPNKQRSRVGLGQPQTGWAEEPPQPHRKSKRGRVRDGAEDAILRGGVEDTDPKGEARRLLKGYRIYTLGNSKARMGRRKGRARVPPTREEYGMADRFIGTMVGLRPGDPDGEIL